MGLYDLGIPKNSMTAYELAIEIRKYVLVARDTADQVATANRIVEATESSAVGRYSDTA